MPKLACFRTKHAEIYAFFRVNFHFCRIRACVKELTNIICVLMMIVKSQKCLFRGLVRQLMMMMMDMMSYI